jgi:cyclophilin family peptidyl-prolyl cis-trans isomerase
VNRLERLPAFGERRKVRRPKKHTVFGKVVDGMDTLKKLEAGGTVGEGTPPEPLLIEKVTIQVS